MVPLYRLAAACKTRRAATVFPAQIVCRVLGNTEKPCPADPVCRPAETHGLTLFYAALGAGAFGIGLCCYWLLRFTGIAWLLRLLLRPLWPPVRACLRAITAAARWLMAESDE